MKWISFLKVLALVFLLSLTSILQSLENELLKTSDISTIMQQIFDQHVDKKAISADILKHSFSIYIDQFDPDRVYLLESEVNPFLNPSDKEIQQRIDQYKKGNFSAYTDINSIIDQSIVRAREIRTEIEHHDRNQLFNAVKNSKDEANSEEGYTDPDIKRPFVKTEAELKTRIRHQVVKFLDLEKKKFGEALVTTKQSQALAFYDRRIESFENQYLYHNEQGKPLASKEQENLFVLHVLKSLASSLDAHTSFFNPEEAYDMKVRLEKEFYGIGVVLQEGIDGIVVTQVIPGSPAEKIGSIKVNDELLEIDGQRVKDLDFQGIMDKLRGKEGSSVELVLKHAAPSKGDLTFTVKLKRAPIVLNDERVDISYEPINNGIIGKIVLHAFYEGENGISSEVDIRNAIQKLEKAGTLQGLVLDLRNNGGGYLSQAVKVAGLFITNGVVVISKYSNGEERFYRDLDGKMSYDGPLVILTSRATASAAEIVAQALQDYGVAVIVGDDHTYGKGSIQSQTVTSGQSSSYFKVTVGKYYTVSGNSPQIRGVKADIVVASRFMSEHIGEEYLHYPLSYDTIPAAYNDTLSDVDSNQKSWYLKYYAPTLQHRTDMWTKLLPVLKKNSEYRLSRNKNYQLLLKGKQPENHIGDDQNNQVQDLQMAEAVNVVKDMITLHSHWNTGSIGKGDSHESFHEESSSAMSLQKQK